MDENTVSTDREELASPEGPQTLATSKRGEISSSEDFGIGVPDKKRLLATEGTNTTPQDHGFVSVKLSPPKHKKLDSLPPRRVEKDNGTKRSPKRKLSLSDDLTLAIDEADIDGTPQKVQKVITACRLSSPKIPTPNSELTQCVSPFKEGRISSQVLKVPAPVSEGASPKSPHNHPLVSTSSEKSPRQREGSPTVESGAPESPEVSPIVKPSCDNTTLPLDESSSNVLNGDETREKSNLASSDTQNQNNSSSDGVSEKSATFNTENSSDVSSHAVTTSSNLVKSPKMDGSQNSPSSDSCCPTNSLEASNVLPPVNDCSVESTVGSEPSTEVPTLKDDTPDTASHQEASDGETADQDESIAQAVLASAEEIPSEEALPAHSPGMRTSENDEPKPNPPKDIIVCDEESVDSGNASEDDEKRKNRAKVSGNFWLRTKN